MDKKTVLHKADTRGHADHGWLDTYHTFSFDGYYDPSRIRFGTLRVLNDDRVAPGRGFGMHSHANMEVVSIPLTGSLEHRDSLGHEGIISTGEVQLMSAGSGIEHSEFNPSGTEDVEFLQIWVFPDKNDTEPAYFQRSYSDRMNGGQPVLLVSPDGEDNSLPIKQDAWFTLVDFDSPTIMRYKLRREGSGVYFFIIEGELDIEGYKLERRDGIGIVMDNIEIKSVKNTRLLIIEVPMN